MQQFLKRAVLDFLRVELLRFGDAWSTVLPLTQLAHHLALKQILLGQHSLLASLKRPKLKSLVKPVYGSHFSLCFCI